MPEEVRPDQPQPEQPNHGQSPRGSARPSGPERSDCCDDWRSCEPPPYCGPAPPYWDPYCGPPPYHGQRHHHWRHWAPPPMPGGGFFESMMRFAASSAGFRERWWREMADAAHYARRDYCDPCAPYPYSSDPCPPPWSYRDPCAPYSQACDPCPPPWSCCDPCAPQYEHREGSETADSINLKELRATLVAGKDERLRKLQRALEEAESSEFAKKSPEVIEKMKRDFIYERSKAEAAVDAVIHDVKLARVAEAMRRKKWSRGAPPGRRY